jgi:RNA polymerase sigma factor (sigma-70 family)
VNEASESIAFWLDNAGRYPVLTQEQLSLIYKRMEKLEEGSPKYTKLLNKVVNSNLRLVARIVVSYMRTKACKKWGSVDTLDYLQAGSIGLMQAAKKYDPRRGYKFSTYAFNWVKCYIGRLNIQMSSPMKLSEEASRIAYSVEHNAKITRGNNGRPYSKEKAYEIYTNVKIAQSMVSLDTRSPSGDTTLMDCCIDIESSQMSMLDEIIYDDYSSKLVAHFDEHGISEYERNMLIDVVVNKIRPCAIDRTLGLEDGATLQSKRVLVTKLKKVGAPAIFNV